LPIHADVRPVLRVEAWDPEDPVTEEAISAVRQDEELAGDHHDVDLVDDLAIESEPFPVGGGVEPGRGTAVSGGPFPRPALPNRTCEFPRIRLSARARR
jgi:hypothetical protein